MTVKSQPISTNFHVYVQSYIFMQCIITQARTHPRVVVVCVDYGALYVRRIRLAEAATLFVTTMNTTVFIRNGHLNQSID